VRVLGDPHIDNVAGRQIDLGRRSGPLDHDDVVLRDQLVERGLDHRPDTDAALAPRHPRQRLVHLPHQHHLAVRVALGFQQQRVHAHLGCRTGGQCLEILRAADFATGIGSGPIFRRAAPRPTKCGGAKISPLGGQRSTRSDQRGRHNPRVVAHVLRLERSDCEALARIVTTQGGGQPAFTGAAGGAQHHHASGRHGFGILGNATHWPSSEQMLMRWSKTASSARCVAASAQSP
jgi:hypothetical protein